MDVMEIKRRAAPVLQSYGVTRASVFGSVARGTANPKSDVDLLVRFGRPIGMVEYMQFIERIEEVLERSVDVVTEKSLSKYLKPRIEHDLKTIYEG